MVRAAATLDDGMHEYHNPGRRHGREHARVGVAPVPADHRDRATGRTLVQAADPSVEFHQFQAGRIVTVQQPAAGAWHVRVAGRGLFFLVVQGRSAVSLHSVELVDESGRPGDERLSPAGQPPKAGVPRMLRITVSGRLADVRARLVTPAFNDLQPLTLRPTESADDSQVFLAEFSPPRSPFRLVVSGADDRGLPLQRVHPPLLEPTR